MRRGESLDCKGESVDPMAVRVEGGGEACVQDKETRRPCLVCRTRRHGDLALCGKGARALSCGIGRVGRVGRVGIGQKCAFQGYSACMPYRSHGMWGRSWDMGES